MPFNDDSLTDIERTRSAIGGLKAIMDSLSLTGNGIPSSLHDALAELEERVEFLERRAIVLKVKSGLIETPEEENVAHILEGLRHR